MGLASPFATYVPIQVNHNIALMPFWALAALTAWLAFERGGVIAWASFGLTVGLGLCAKYAILPLVPPAGITFPAVPQWLRQLLTSGPLVAVWLAGFGVGP